MPFIEKSCIIGKHCFIFQDKNIILKTDNTLPDFSYLKELNYFTDTEFDYTCATLPQDVQSASCDTAIYKKLISTLESGQMISIPLRQYFAGYSEEQNFLAARAHSIALWRQQYQFCPECGGKLCDDEKASARKCKKCCHVIFPRVEPCIIVLVKKDDKMLLVKNARTNAKFYACVAGFIEAGESAEHAVAREVFEETGIKVKNIKYKGSQGWPFPDQLMLAFTAEYLSGEIVLQKEELSEGGWFLPDEIPETPRAGSVAYRLINDLWD
jgi:NAD+ diphosphatase